MIEINIVSKKYGDHEVIKNFNHKIKDKEMVALIGPSGCGKSTLLNMIGLLDDDYDGVIKYDGVDVKSLKTKKKEKFIRENINYLFQNYALIDDESVNYNLLLALEYENISIKEKNNLIKDVLKKVGLAGCENKKIFTLSGGEQQRIALARILLKKGNIVLADEPTGNLDENNSKKVFELLKELKKIGKTIIIVTHNDKLAKECDSIIELS